MNNAKAPAMPMVGTPETDWLDSEAGLTKREYFAGLAMQAYISGNFAWSDGIGGGSVYPGADECASESVDYADALLKALEE